MRKLGALLLATLITGGYFASASLAKPGRIPQKATIKTQTKASGRTLNQEEKVSRLLGRITFGAKPGDIEKVEAMGVDAFIEEQLHPGSIPLPERVINVALAPAVADTVPQLVATYGRPVLKAAAEKSGEVGNNKDPENKKDANKFIGETYRKLYLDMARARLVRAVESPRQLQEVMTDFWFNHFNVSFDKGLDHIMIGAYEEQAIRPHVLGRFRDLLGATAHHGAMLFYLDNWQNTAVGSPLAKLPKAGANFKGINENYARELMELHTLGVDGGYTQKDVQELARVLTGLGLPGRRMPLAAGNGQNFKQRPGQAQGNQYTKNFGGDQVGEANNYVQFGCRFDPLRHDNGDKVVLGETIHGGGQQEIEYMLDLLARHPSTAKHIAYKLAQYFVADEPPKSLVDKLANKYLETDGQIAEVLNTLFHSSEFYDPKYEGAKFKSPYRYLISSLRATDATIDDVKPLVGYLKQAGQPLYQCLTPDGYKNTKDRWLNPDALINRLNVATALGSGRLPGVIVSTTNTVDIADACTTPLSDKTMQAIKGAEPQLKAALVLGSPEFMKY